MAVGRSWRLGSGGSSLYGDYWVDRPPGLVTLYGLADRLGGLPALRLMGAVAALIVVLAVADICRTASRSTSSQTAAAWGAVVASALVCSPFHWSFMVDGELLAAPTAAVGIALAVRCFASEGQIRLWYAGGAGFLAFMAAMTKQNFLDVFALFVGLILASLATKATSLREITTRVSVFAAGIAVALAGTCGWTLAHGTSLGAVWYAMFPFRVDAAAAKGAADAVSGARLADLGTAALLSGLLLVVVCGVGLTTMRARRDPVAWALTLVLVYDVVSVGAGTNYWLHYLVQPVVPAAALLGILIPRAPWARLLAAGCVGSAVVGMLALAQAPPQTAEELVGRTIGRASQHDDRIVTFPGHANVNLAAGLESDYPYLWTLPAQTLDPRSGRLKTLLKSADGPEWVVAWTRLRPSPAPESIGSVLAANYRPVARICGMTIFLRSDLERSTPVPDRRASATAQSACESVTRMPPILRDLT